MSRGATRERIKQIALELFTRQGYEQTSLREIAEHLDVTKAALYYHFKTKEDILVALLEERIRPVEELIAWARNQPAGLLMRQEALRRYAAALARTAPLIELFQENRSALHSLSVAAAYRDVMARVLDVFRCPQSGLTGQVRSATALLTLHLAPKALADAEGSIAEQRAAALDVALELLTSAHTPSAAAGRAPAAPAATEVTRRA